MDQPHPHESIPTCPEQVQLPDSSPLDHVVDDLEPKLAWGEWAADEMSRGRSAEELADELVANGWSEDDAAELVETARRQTRHLRGVITREEVARENAARYHKATALNALFGLRFVSTTFLSIAAARRLLNSLSYMLRSRGPGTTHTPSFAAAPPAPAPPESPPDAPEHEQIVPFDESGETPG